MSSNHRQTILELNNVGFRYDMSKPFIEHLSFSVGDGEYIGLLGANGSGKSTLLRLASGILKPTEGSITLWSKQLPSYNNKDRAKLLSYLPQMLDVNVPFTVREIVAMGLYPYDIPPEMKIDDALEIVGLKEKAASTIATLSGGEKRRAFIAMTLLQGTGLLLLDEPLANLDIKYRIELQRLLKRLQETKNISIIMALHDVNAAFQFEKVMLIKEGKILGIGKPEDILTAELLQEAFDVPVELQKTASGGTYIRYEM
jgi:ABC-type cobalamin/Fe3+-siderophores transport system ATPase subunit